MDTLAWQVAEGSSTAHVIDPARPGGKRTGPKALCGKYPQRMRSWWFELPVADMPSVAPYRITKCADCEHALTTTGKD